MGGRLVNNLPPIYISLLYTDTSIELRTILLPFWTSVASTDSLVTLSRMPVSNACPGFQFGLADFTAAYIAVGREGTSYTVCTLGELRSAQVNMFTTVFIGNEGTQIIDGKLVTRRGYQIE